VLESECSQLWVTQTKVWTTLCQLSDEWRVLESECSQLWVTQTKVWTTLLSVEWWVESVGVWMWSVVGYWQKYGQPSVSWVMCGECWSLNVISCGYTDKSMDNPLSVEWWVESVGVWMWSVVGYWQKYGQPSVSWVMSGEYWSLNVISCGLLTKVLTHSFIFKITNSGKSYLLSVKKWRFCSI
jgi:hypothetical protein